MKVSPELLSLFYAAGGRCYLRVAIVHHWLVTQGGGERVLEALASMFPDADIFTLIADPRSIPSRLRSRRITQSFLAVFHGRADFTAIFSPSTPWPWSNWICEAMTWSLPRMRDP